MVVFVCCVHATLGQSPSAETSISFNQDIRPILNQHCVACHGGVKQAGGLSFAYGDEASYIVEPESPEESLLIQRVTSADADEHMPPPEHGRALNNQELDLLTQWIRQGGKWGQHWAFEPPIASEAAEQHGDWGRNRIDGFVYSKLQAIGVTPSPDASPERWLRRASLDLTGLPSTPSEREQFLRSLADAIDPDSVYEAAVDRLLESPAFGERWASMWLDLVRYADSKGLGIDGRRSIWKYRDWVICAFNEDMPFDEFTIKQLAGDLLPNPTMDDLVATACNRLTQTCEEGGTDDEQFRVEAVIDRVNTTMLAWQGLTFGCVQCHAHPYDPIRHEEYYQLLAYFNNSADCDLDNEDPRIDVPLDDSRAGEAIQIDQTLDALQVADWESGYSTTTQSTQWLPLQLDNAATNNTTRVEVATVEEAVEYQTRGTVAKNTTVIVEAALPAGMLQLTALNFTGLPRDETAARIDSEWGFVLSHVKIELLREGEQSAQELRIETVIGDEPRPLNDPQLSLDAKNSQGFGAYSRIHYPRSASFLLAEAVELQPNDRIRVSLAQNVFALGAFPLVAHRGRFAVTSDPALIAWQSDPTRQERLARLRELKSLRRDIPSVAIPIMREREQKLARPTFVFDRGNYLTKSTSVEPGTPEFLPATAGARDRLAFAQWIASENNPLTARVAVNRFWAQLFGVGLVETQEDFGSSGGSPSHPQLLDDLAFRFSHDMNWSVKQLLRELTLSSTYRQSAIASPERLAADPSNRWLSRGPRSRLPAEVIRDQALAISGLLSRKPFGPPVHPPIPEGVWQPFQGGDKWETPSKGDPDRYRRTLYTYTKRTIQFPILASFDAPTREFCTPRRLPSNTPLQALMTLNDATFVEASEALADRMQLYSDDPRQQIRHGIELATCRAATQAEIEQLMTLSPRSASDNDRKANGLESASHLAALQSIATVLLNLDEVLCQ